MKYSIMKNIKNIPDYRSWSVIDETPTELHKSSKFLDFQKSARLRAISALNVDKQVDSLPKPYGFDRYKITDLSIIDYIAKEVNLYKPSGRVQVLPPGAMSMMHLDDLATGYVQPFETSLHDVKFTDDELEKFKQDNYFVTRYLIPLEDSKPGQGFVFGTDALTEWKAGDVISWDWVKTVHSTYNTGFWDRPLLRISGIDLSKL